MSKFCATFSLPPFFLRACIKACKYTILHILTEILAKSLPETNFTLFAIISRMMTHSVKNCLKKYEGNFVSNITIKFLKPIYLTVNTKSADHLWSKNEAIFYSVCQHYHSSKPAILLCKASQSHSCPLSWVPLIFMSFLLGRRAGDVIMNICSQAPFFTLVNA
jgi:hypothetical protein